MRTSSADLIGYPGIRTMVTADQQQLEKHELKPNHKSAYDHQNFTKAAATSAEARAGRRSDGHQIERNRRVIIDLGAAGGVAALPGAGRPKLSVWKPERGSRAATCTRRVAQQLSRLAERTKASQEIPTSRPRRRRRAAKYPSDAEQGRRHHVALLGAELAAEPVGLQSRQRDDATLRRRADRDRPSGLAFGYDEPSRTTTRSMRGRHLRPAGNINGTIDPRGNRFEGHASGLPMPPLRGTAFIEKMTAAARTIGWHPFPRRGDQLAHLPEPLGLHVSSLQPRQLPCGREELDRGDDDSTRGRHRASARRHARTTTVEIDRNAG
jgi:hypothetical protein